jgi:hypothetical protein
VNPDRSGSFRTSQAPSERPARLCMEKQEVGRWVQLLLTHLLKGASECG